MVALSSCSSDGLRKRQAADAPQRKRCPKRLQSFGAFKRGTVLEVDGWACWNYVVSNVLQWLCCGLSYQVRWLCGICRCSSSAWSSCWSRVKLMLDNGEQKLLKERGEMRSDTTLDLKLACMGTQFLLLTFLVTSLMFQVAGRLSSTWRCLYADWWTRVYPHWRGELKL